MGRVTQTAKCVSIAFVSAAIVVAASVAVESALHARPIQYDQSLFALEWAFYGALYAALFGLVIARLGDLSWWKVLAVCAGPLMVAAIASWPPPHLIKACIPEIECGPSNYHVEWGVQVEAWPYYLYPLVKYALAFPAAIIGFILMRRVQMRSNPSLERP